MRIVRHEDIEKDFKQLRRFPAPQESLGAWEMLFIAKGLYETPGIDQVPSFGQLKIYKGRVIPMQENVGKSKGYRVIFRMIDADCAHIIVFSRHGIYHSEGELLTLIKHRLAS